MAEKAESKAEVQSKYERAMARMANMRKEMTEKEAELLDGALTIAGGAAGGLLCREFGPYGEGSADIPVNLTAGLVLTGLGLADVPGDYSGEVAALGIGMLAFQSGLWTYGDGYQEDDSVQGAPEDDEVGAEKPRRKRGSKRKARRSMREDARRSLPQGSAAVMTYDRIQELLAQGRGAAA